MNSRQAVLLTGVLSAFVLSTPAGAVATGAPGSASGSTGSASGAGSSATGASGVSGATGSTGSTGSANGGGATATGAPGGVSGATGSTGSANGGGATATGAPAACRGARRVRPGRLATPGPPRRATPGACRALPALRTSDILEQPAVATSLARRRPIATSSKAAAAPEGRVTGRPFYFGLLRRLLARTVPCGEARRFPQSVEPILNPRHKRPRNTRLRRTSRSSW